MKLIINRRRSERVFLLILFLTPVLILPSVEAAEGKTKSRALQQREIKAQFEYSFNDVFEHIVTISGEGEFGRSAGSGFVAVQNGKAYLFTNQHVILGWDHISFRTAAGKNLAPTGVDLSVSRDIARLHLADVTEGFGITEKGSEGTPVVVFGNSEGAGVARALYGKVMGGNDDIVEVSAEFVSGNSGSPVLTPNREVLGIASFVRYFDEDKDGCKTRRFCYRLAGDHWKSVNWKRYNAKYGKAYRENERFVDSLFKIMDTWRNAPFSRMAAENYSDVRLRSWASRQNEIVDKIMYLSDKGEATQRKLDLTNQQIRQGMKDRARILSLLCKTSARSMQKLSQQRELTRYLHDEYMQLAVRLVFIEREIEHFSDEVSTLNFFHFKNR